jgi:hypothetical protein
VLQLLADKGARNYTVDICGETSKGKTTTLRVAGSVWGMPEENGGPSVLSSWNTTRVGAERRVGLVNGLPTFRDDTKLAKHKEDVAQCLYEVGSGRTCDRGTVKGLNRTSSFTTVLLTTGESRAVSFSEDGGTRARTLTLWGAPFGGVDAKTAELVNRLNTGILRDFGHAGPMFVRFLLNQRHYWPEWKTRYVDLKERYLCEAQANPVVGRLADAFAVISLAG